MLHDDSNNISNKNSDHNNAAHCPAINIGNLVRSLHFTSKVTKPRYTCPRVSAHSPATDKGDFKSLHLIPNYDSLA